MRRSRDCRAAVRAAPRAAFRAAQLRQTGGEWSNADAPILIHFGDSDFEDKFLTVLNDIGQWRAGAGSVESVDLRFNGEAVVNPDPTLVAKADLSAPMAAPKPNGGSSGAGEIEAGATRTRDTPRDGKKLEEGRCRETCKSGAAVGAGHAMPVFLAAKEQPI